MTDDIYDREVNTARMDYRPSTINCLLLAESPPGNGRFFYFPDSIKYDYLFINVMEGIYPGFAENYYDCDDKPKIKAERLCQFKEDGFYLHDVYRDTGEILKLKPETAKSRLIDDLSDLKLGQAPIIIIKASIFDLTAFSLCKAGFNVVDSRMPFPAQGGQGKFLEAFCKALKSIGWNNGWSNKQ